MELFAPIACAVAFLLGSIPFGVVVAKAYKINDLTERGSGNIGATNVSRVIGKKAGILVFALDLIKGALAVFLVSPWLMPAYAEMPQFSEVEASLGLSWACGLLAVLGHCFTPWLKLKGGKGVATAFGAILLLSPWAALGGIVAFALAFASRRLGSLASLSGVTAAAAVHLMLNGVASHLWAGALIVFVIVIRHEANIDALLEGSERKF